MYIHCNYISTFSTFATFTLLIKPWVLRFVCLHTQQLSEFHSTHNTFHKISYTYVHFTSSNSLISFQLRIESPQKKYVDISFLCLNNCIFLVVCSSVLFMNPPQGQRLYHAQKVTKDKRMRLLIGI